MQIIVYYFLFFPNLGVMPMNISKLMPGMGRDNTERYSSSNRLLMLPLATDRPIGKRAVFPVSRYSWSKGQIARQGIVITRHGITLAVITPFVKQAPCPPWQTSGHRCGKLRHVWQLFADGLVCRTHRFALVDRGSPRESSVHIQFPVLSEHYIKVGVGLCPVSMYLLRFLGRRIPWLWVARWSSRRCANRTSWYHRSKHIHFLSPPRTTTPRRMWSRARFSGRDYRPAENRGRSAWENGSSGRWMLSPRYCLFSTVPVDEESRITGAHSVPNISSRRTSEAAKRSTGRHFAETEPENSTRPLSYPTTALLPSRDDIFVRAFHQMLVYGNTGREQPFLWRSIIPVRTSVERVNLTAWAGHRSHFAVSLVPLVIIGHPCVYSRLYTDLPFLPPRDPTRGRRETSAPFGGSRSPCRSRNPCWASPVPGWNWYTRRLAWTCRLRPCYNKFPARRADPYKPRCGCVPSGNREPMMFLSLVIDVFLLVPVSVFVVVGEEEYTTRVEDCQCLSP